MYILYIEQGIFYSHFQFHENERVTLNKCHFIDSNSKGATLCGLTKLKYLETGLSQLITLFCIIIEQKECVSVKKALLSHLPILSTCLLTESVDN